MKLYSYKYYTVIGIMVILIGGLTGCATQASYFRLDSSLQKDIRVLNGAQYVPLIRLCDVYGLECRWDSFIKTATLQKRSNNIVLRADSDRVLINGAERRLEGAVIFNGGAVFVPISFVKNNLGPIIGAVPAERIPEAEIPRKALIRTIVVDPGHGGKDPGAIGRRARLMEKYMTLAVARKLRERLEGSGLRVIMTRNDDTFIPLSKRAEIANHNGADLFVSVHINSSRARSMRGFECYYLSNATDDNARALEAFENSSLKMGEEASAEHSKQLDKTLWDMTLTENRLESAELASSICDSVEGSLAIGNRGIRSARFYVLKYTHMPSILVEAGYISNKYEEMKLRDPQFLDRLANAIAEGILKYKKEFERTGGFTNT